MSASPFASYSHDIVGNRVSKTEGGATVNYAWDAVNRMVSYGPQGGSDPMLYTYRADGMRVKSATQGSYERTYYDGQMPVESDKYSLGSTTVTKNFLGARGIEGITTVTSTSTDTVYPLYDTHGNMVATLSKDGTGSSWSLGNQRSYDVWGGVRTGSATGGPKGRYCANLGHVQDDESGLVYMRARYYEPSTGRFVSEDGGLEPGNWYAYCNNNPINYTDCNGNSKGDGAAVAMFMIGLILTFIGLFPPLGPITAALGIVLAGLGLRQSLIANKAMEIMRSELEAAKKTIDTLEKEGEAAEHTLAGPTVAEFARESGEVVGALLEMGFEDSYDQIFINGDFDPAAGGFPSPFGGP